MLCFLIIWLVGRREKRNTQNEQRAAYQRKNAKREKIIELYRDGFEVGEIAQETKRSIASVRSILVHRGIYKKIDEERALSRAERLAGSLLELPLLVAGTKIAIDKLQEHFSAVGMTRVQQVTGVGQYSVRGGIVDYFKWGETYITRLDFFGDIIESVKEIPAESDLAERPAQP